VVSQIFLIYILLEFIELFLYVLFKFLKHSFHHSFVLRNWGFIPFTVHQIFCCVIFFTFEGTIFPCLLYSNDSILRFAHMLSGFFNLNSVFWLDWFLARWLYHICSLTWGYNLVIAIS
jgi:hypothetical protein